MTQRGSYALCLMAISLGLFAPVRVLYAEVAAGGGALFISPAKTEIAVAPGEENVTIITLRNTTPVPLTVTLRSGDVHNDANGTSFALVEGDGAPRSALASWMSFPNDEITLLSGSSKEIPVTVRIPKDAEPGGRYGAFIAEFALSSSASGSGIIPKSRLASLFFVRINGVVRESGQLTDFGVVNERVFYPVPSSGAPLLFHISYENTGTVHTNPYGQILLDPLWGETRIVEVDPWIVLPGSVRSRDLLLSELPPGIYAATLFQNRGYGDVVDEKKVRFVVYPGTKGIFGIGIGVLVFLLIMWRSLRISRNRV